jgi:DNA-binding HxlR family transcriptional regulator
VRYATIKSAIPDITDRMLSERLRSLESEDVLDRRVLPESPIRVEYELTAKGRSLENALREIGTWAEKWIPADALAANPEHADPTSEERTKIRRTKTA